MDAQLHTTGVFFRSILSDKTEGKRGPLSYTGHSPSLLHNLPAIFSSESSSSCLLHIVQSFYFDKVLAPPKNEVFEVSRA